MLGVAETHSDDDPIGDEGFERDTHFAKCKSAIGCKIRRSVEEIEPGVNGPLQLPKSRPE
jgi:hypothetical protein